MKKNGNKRLTIGFFIDAVFLEYHTKILKGIIDASKKFDINVVCFKGDQIDLNFYNSKERSRVFSLAHKNNIDGLIILSGSIFNHINEKKIINFINSLPDVPIISLGYPLKNNYSVIIDNKHGITEIVEHLILSHKCRKIAFINGPENNHDAKIRHNEYKSVLKKHEIKYNPDYVFWGDFWYFGGRNAVNEFLDVRKLSIDAVVAGNDYMAISAIDELEKRGIRVPDDIKVTGFDNIRLGQKIKTPLTTVNQPFYKMAYHSVEKLAAVLNNQSVSRISKFHSKLLIKKSCGCNETGDNNFVKQKKKLNYLHLSRNKSVIQSQFFHRFTLALNSRFSYRQLNEIIKEELELLDIQSCYIVLFDKSCKMNEGILVVNYNKNYKDNTKIDKIDFTELIPGGVKKYFKRAPFIMFSLYNENEQIGYIIFELSFINCTIYETITLHMNEILKNIMMFQSLQEYSENLEKTVKERTIELEKINRRIENESQRKSDFFINLSHELKTPLSLISGYMERYLENNDSSEEINIIKHNIDKLKKDMINFFDYEKLRMGRLFYKHDEIINLSNTVKSISLMFKESNVNKNIDINIDLQDDIYIKIDSRAVDRIINNLIDNAMKYTKKGLICITLKKNLKNTVLDIKDTGIGISIKQQKNIFKPYYQISHKKQNIQGIGMGLNIIKRIIDQIDGKIEINSMVNKGTTIRILFKNYEITDKDNITDFIKLSKINRNNNIDLIENKYDSDKSTVLLVEDNPELLYLIKKNFDNKYNVFFAFNGKQALKKLNIIPRPDLIISDIMMDEMDGYEFCKNVLKNIKYEDIPFIFLSAKTSLRDKIKGLSKGAIDFINKPFILKELSMKVDSIIILREKIRTKIDKINNELKNKKNKVIYEAFINKCRIYKLSDREISVVKYLTQGFEYKEIGDKLDITLNTVRYHIKNVYKKCNIQNKSELISLLILDISSF